MKLCGLDEVGRGALAGPLVAAAVILKDAYKIKNLKDSKQLNSKQRSNVYKEIWEQALVVRIETISVRQINNRGIGWANKEVFRKLIRFIDADKYIVDGNLKIKVRGKSKYIQSVVKADSNYPEVMAASIIAKVTRDRLMNELHDKHPNYGWRTNVGYGTRYHINAIREHGRVRHHRTRFVDTALTKIILTKSKSQRQTTT